MTYIPHDDELTNRTRHVVKKRFLRRSIVILQVEIERDWREWRGQNLHVGTNRFWRNATKEDLDYLIKTNRLKS